MKKIMILSIMALIVTMPLTQAECKTENAECVIVNIIEVGNYNGYTNITVHEAWNMLTTTSDGIQNPIDIRRLNEWEDGRIDTPPPENPVLWENLHLGTGLENFMNEYADKEVVIYCRSANRSWTATKLLINNGFTGTIYHMLGGINAWKAEGYPVYSNNLPTEPVITGPSNGKVGSRYDYGFCSTDPDGDNVVYCIDWGDDTGEVCIGPFPSGVCIYESHAYTSAGTFTIRAKAGDGELESGYTDFEVTMPRNIISIDTIIQRLFERFPNMFPIIRQLLCL